MGERTDEGRSFELHDIAEFRMLCTMRSVLDKLELGEGRGEV